MRSILPIGNRAALVARSWTARLIVGKWSSLWIPDRRSACESLASGDFKRRISVRGATAQVLCEVATNSAGLFRAPRLPPLEVPSAILLWNRPIPTSTVAAAKLHACTLRHFFVQPQSTTVAFAIPATKKTTPRRGRRLPTSLPCVFQHRGAA